MIVDHYKPTLTIPSFCEHLYAMFQISSVLVASPPTVEPSGSGTTHQLANSTSMPKLRDSCVVCASSKVRCHRQKPSCSRCLKRKIACEYVTSKRDGRNPTGRPEATTAASKPNTESSSRPHVRNPRGCQLLLLSGSVLLFTTRIPFRWPTELVIRQHHPQQHLSILSSLVNPQFQ